MTDDSQILQPDATFGQHRIVRLLGRGGMGEVYEVEHKLTGKRHALKLLSPDVMEQPGSLERFHKEAKVMARMEHAGIVKVDLAGEDDGRHWLRMELMNGREVAGQRVVTLEEFVTAKGGRLSEAEVKALLGKILDALGHAHAKGLVHCDLKPANVLFDGEVVKIADFGLVNAAGAEWMETQVRSTVMALCDEETWYVSGSTGSRQRAFMGTYAYMSPEQRKCMPVDPRSDLYAVGKMAFLMLTGEEQEGLELPTELVKDMFRDWDNWVKRALKKDPAKRFFSADDMVQALPNAELSEVPSPEPNMVPKYVSSPEVALSAQARKAFTIQDLSLEMLWCDPGVFTMGSSSIEAGREEFGNDESLHTVTLTAGFWLSKYQVGQAQWEEVMFTNPSKFKGASLPVERVTWYGARSFCKKLTYRERKAGRLPEDYAYQLPTEAQWEYACRAGTDTAYTFGDSITSKQANYDSDVGQTTAVGTYPANAWGFHDLHGNVLEWCLDWYGEYPSGSVRDPVGPAVGTNRVLRGGSWFNPAQDLRSAFRHSLVPKYRGRGLGFRVSLQLVK